jgi:hypothetical protein
LNKFNREILKDKTRKADFEKTNEKNSNVVILMPDNKKTFGKSEIKPKVDEVIYFNKLGYAKNNGLLGKKKLFQGPFTLSLMIFHYPLGFLLDFSPIPNLKKRANRASLCPLMEKNLREEDSI